PEPVTLLGAVLVLASFAAFAAAPHALWLLVLGTLVFDLGVQASLIAHQSIIYGLEPAARSRLNAVLIGGMFLGMSAGSALGSLALEHAGWRGVSLFAASCALAALLTRVWPQRT
ncbi:MAG: MFS transporter, partial [Candidatus Dactylopiibacterium sp.]|nr:MFS transporter [Candidatus Dactylopiibacterium sp.]